ncbi:hypothetical protein FGB62_92g121 [Gracilaria domingensis]|nr:hypothetical protein FGB62_92g121 [Gracilaria domingensis]
MRLKEEHSFLSVLSTTGTFALYLRRSSEVHRILSQTAGHRAPLSFRASLSLFRAGIFLQRGAALTGSTKSERDWREKEKRDKSVHQKEVDPQSPKAEEQEMVDTWNKDAPQEPELGGGSWLRANAVWRLVKIGHVSDF